MTYRWFDQMYVYMNRIFSVTYQWFVQCKFAWITFSVWNTNDLWCVRESNCHRDLPMVCVNVRVHESDVHCDIPLIWSKVCVHESNFNRGLANNDLAVSWNVLWGMAKVYWLDLNARVHVSHFHCKLPMIWSNARVQESDFQYTRHWRPAAGLSQTSRAKFYRWWIPW